MIRRLLIALLLLTLLPAQALARGFPSIQPIATPGAIPAGATRVDVLRPVDRSLVEQAVEDVAEAWNGGGLSDLLSDDFRNRSRLFDTIAEVVPRDARLNVLAVQAVSTLEQYLLDGQRVSTVSAVVRSQIEFNGPETGFQRLEGTGEWYFRVEEGRVVTLSADDAAVLMAPPASPTPGRPFIERVDPPTLRWDSMMTIVGRGFGEDGQVMIYRAGQTSSTPLIEATWTNRVVQARLEPAIALAARSVTEPSTAVVWLCPGASTETLAAIVDSCGGKEITILPAVAALSPVIDEVITDLPVTAEPVSVHPGRPIQVNGDRFRSTPGSATFLIGDQVIPAEITSWRDDVIHLVLPSSVEGLVEQTGTLRITNDAGFDDEVPISFKPRRVDQWIAIEFSADCPTSAPLSSFQDVFFRGGGLLRNGWYVAEDARRIHRFDPPPWRTPGDVGCFFAPGGRPSVGSTTTNYTVECSCPDPAVPSRRVIGEVQIKLRGPAGTRHGHERYVRSP